MNEKLIKLLQDRLAESLGATALRNQGRPGVVAKARRYLKSIDLSAFSVNTEQQFAVLLNAHTRDLKKFLPRGARHWGAARKALNLFLRDVLYNRYLCRRYGFRRLEKWLEVPLDSYVAKTIRKKYEAKPLPPWKGIKHLTPKVSQPYQDAANALALAPPVSGPRVHLDILYWRGVGVGTKTRKQLTREQW